MVFVKNKYVKFVCGSYVISTAFDAVLLSVWFAVFSYFITDSVVPSLISVVLLAAIFAIRYSQAPFAFRLVKIGQGGISIGRSFLSWRDVKQIEVYEGLIKQYFGLKRIDDLLGTASYVYYLAGQTLSFNGEFVDFRSSSGIYFTVNNRVLRVLQKYCSVYGKTLPEFNKNKRQERKRNTKKTVFDCIKILLILIVFVFFQFECFYPNLWEQVFSVLLFVAFWLKKMYETVFKHRSENRFL